MAIQKMTAGKESERHLTHLDSLPPVSDKHDSLTLKAFWWPRYQYCTFKPFTIKFPEIKWSSILSLINFSNEMPTRHPLCHRRILSR